MSKWYFYEDVTKAGPIDSTNLKHLAKTGRLKPDTIVETKPPPSLSITQSKKAVARAEKKVFRLAD